jgi:hypothetical protein
MKRVLLQERLIWRALREGRSSEFDVLWEILQSSKVQGYITAQDLGMLYRRIAHEQNTSVALALVERFCRVLEIYPGIQDCPLDAAIAEEDATDVQMEQDDVPLLSVKGFLKRYALYELYVTDRQSFQIEGWYRKWRASGFDPLLLIPIALTLWMQNLPAFKELLADLLDVAPGDADPFNPILGDRVATVYPQNSSYAIPSQHQPVADGEMRDLMIDPFGIEQPSGDRHFLIPPESLDFILTGDRLSSSNMIARLSEGAPQLPSRSPDSILSDIKATAIQTDAIPQWVAHAGAQTPDQRGNASQDASHETTPAWVSEDTQTPGAAEEDITVAASSANPEVAEDGVTTSSPTLGSSAASSEPEGNGASPAEAAGNLEGGAIEFGTASTIVDDAPVEPSSTPDPLTGATGVNVNETADPVLLDDLFLLNSQICFSDSFLLNLDSNFDTDKFSWMNLDETILGELPFADALFGAKFQTHSNGDFPDINVTQLCSDFEVPTALVSCP